MHNAHAEIQGPDKPWRGLNLERTTVTAVPCLAELELSSLLALVFNSYNLVQVAIYHDTQTATLFY